MTNSSRPALAYHLTEGDGPTIIFLPGYASDMTGGKATALAAWAKDAGRAFLRFDYGGCGQSGGKFEDQTLAGWRDDALAMIDEAVQGPVILVGSSMGGWIMLLAALARPERVKGLVGIAPAPDFTDWGFSEAQKKEVRRAGRLLEPSPYSDEPTLFTRAFFESGDALRVMHAPIEFTGPVRLLQGSADREVPWQRAAALAEFMRSADVQTILVKGGDHRLSRDRDIALIIRAIEDVIAAC